MQPAVQAHPPVDLDPQSAAERLAAAIQIQTITRDDAPLPEDALEAFARFLAEHYPETHNTLSHVNVLAHSILYTWQGSDKALPALVLMAHQDVVPAENAETWTVAPFAGEIKDGYVWGRGALDDKGNLLTIMEAVEYLIATGFSPRRTIHLAFGHDEEIGGEGAVALANILEGQEVGMVLDEGMAIVHDQVPGVKAPVALVGISEKGYASLDLVVEQDAGHSSMPPESTSVGILAKAVVALEDAPFPSRLRGPSRQLFEFIAPEADLPYRIAFANLWLFGGAIGLALAGEPTTAALLRTTTAATMFTGSPKDNVLPRRAEATVNVRIAPGETVESVVQRVVDVVNDKRVAINVRDGASDPSPISPVDGRAFRVLQRTILETSPDVLVAPALMIGGTDARHYRQVSDSVLRFSPERFYPGDTDRLHGVDERRSVEGHVAGIRFYIRLIENVNDVDAL